MSELKVGDIVRNLDKGWEITLVHRSGDARLPVWFDSTDLDAGRVVGYDLLSLDNMIGLTIKIDEVGTVDEAYDGKFFPAGSTMS